ncbi:hypothetical protein SLS62_001055 [Diatrype stigma]|uniref:Uncharacterized protein n=1 Tax=Diatrype stigma TaxID=117547 RepID=A0AAN9YWJ8_9PEZI
MAPVRYRKLVGFLLLHIPESSTIEGILSRWTQQVTILKEHVRRLQIQSQAKALAELDRLHGIETSVKGIEQAVNAPAGGIRALLAENGPLQQIVYETVKKAVSEIPEGLPDYVRTTIFADVATIVREDAKSRLRDKRLEEDDMERKRKRLHRDREIFLREREEWLRGQEEYITRGRAAIHTQSCHSLSIYLVNETAERLNIENQATAYRRRSGEIQVRPRAHRQPIKPIHLLSVLGVSMDDAWMDLNTALRQSGGFEAHAQDWARRLIAMPVFRSWLEGDRSSVLLAEGYLDPQRVSPLSGFCCALISGLIEDRDAAVAFFFAGLRVVEDVVGGGAPPAAVMRHLIAQLLLNADLPEPDLGFMHMQTLEDCRRGDFYTLCDVFAAIVRQVPPDMRVFCVVDGIASCEQEPWLAEFRYMVALLEDLAKSARPGREGGLKVLLTTPTWSPTVAELAMRPGSVWLRASLASGDADPEIDTEED